MTRARRTVINARAVFSGLRLIMLLSFIALTGMLFMLLFSVDGALYIGSLYALACSVPLIAFEGGLLLPALLQRIRCFSTPAYFLSSLGIYFVLSGVGFALAGIIMKTTGMIDAHWKQVLLIRPPAFLYTLAFFLSGITILRVRQLLGRRVFLSLLTGRYRTPVQEERIFLFIDLVGSTAYARGFGDLRAQEFLGELFADFAGHVRKHQGEIDDYVGDCAIVTWPMQEGLKEARCVQCLHDILDDITVRAAWWETHFGRVPQLSAALHGGSVVTAEIGVFHHKITYFGDVVNTTARIEALCRTLQRPVLISSDLMQRLTLPQGTLAEPMGAHLVKGRDEPLNVYALSRTGKGRTAEARPRAS
ncbi:adenylate/guanylate cyclase domain-containing protein [Rhizobium straminoryzae]|uniref:Adenylate/guanylate cyclase domain-containing protein n=1 Tax=Rhizobium straminoryzae TaxID=1387186 RepID=A0A549T9K3_9HYPH|nr:adenylate/guanylate cyclase domain-containing protein [Rhizobium straminoryzae]TRL38554.1 adenylate/guanylate cyclase domain-containing protein [Rhizobium straminoryzae]